MSLQFLSDKESLPSQSHTSPVVSVCWVPTSDGSTSSSIILSGDVEGTLKAWGAATAISYKSLPRAHGNAVHCISVNRRGDRALTSSIDGGIALWDLSPFHLNPPTSLDATIPNGEDLSSNHPIESDESPLPLPVQEPNHLIAAQMDSILSKTKTLQDGTKISEAWSTVLHPTRQMFAAVGAGARITLHAATATKMSSANDAEAAEKDFGTLLGSSSLLQTSSGAAQKDLFGLKLVFDATGSLLAMSTNTGQVFVYCLSSTTFELELIGKYADHPSAVRAVSFSADHLFLGGDDRILTVHDVRGIQEQLSRDTESDPVLGGTVATLTGHKGWILETAPLPSSQSQSQSTRIVASISMDKTIKFWDLALNPKQSVCTITESDTIRSFAFQPNPQTEHQTYKQNTALGPNTSQGSSTTTTVGGFGQASRFVTAGNDGRLRWYRSAGV